MKIREAAVVPYRYFSCLMLCLAGVSPDINVSAGVSSLPNITPSYVLVFKDFFKLYLIFCVTVFVSDFLNMWIVTRWQYILRGRYFWLRSLSASFFSMVIFSILGAVLSPYLFDKAFIIKTILLAILIKLSLLIILTYPMVLLCMFLKRAEGLSQQLNFNPFI